MRRVFASTAGSVLIFVHPPPIHGNKAVYSSKPTYFFGPRSAHFSLIPSISHGKAGLGKSCMYPRWSFVYGDVALNNFPVDMHPPAPPFVPIILRANTGPAHDPKRT